MPKDIVSTGTAPPNGIAHRVYGFCSLKPYSPTDADRRIVAHLRRLIGPGLRFASPYALARAAGVDPAAIYRAFTGERGIGIDALVRIHEKLRISIDWLLDEVSEREKGEAIRSPDGLGKAISAELGRAYDVGRAPDKKKIQSTKTGR